MYRSVPTMSPVWVSASDSSVLATEVGHPHRPLKIQQEVGWLDVAVQQLVVVSVGQRVGRLHPNMGYAAIVGRTGAPQDRTGRERRAVARPLVRCGSDPAGSRLVTVGHANLLR